MPPTDPPHQTLTRPPVPKGLLVFIAIAALAFLSTAGILVSMAVKKNRTPGAAPVTHDGATIRVDRPADPNDPGAPDDFVVGLFIPPFELLNQDEKPVTNEIFKGKITVIDFFFTHCPFICPAMTGRFAQLASSLKDVPQAQFLSFSVDPVHDTPARLREYAALHNADPTRWQFLTGTKEVTWNILREGLKWGVEERADQPINLPGGDQMSNISHPGWFALIGPDAKVLGIFKFDVEEDQQRLMERVRKLSAKLNR